METLRAEVSRLTAELAAQSSKVSDLQHRNDKQAEEIEEHRRIRDTWLCGKHAEDWGDDDIKTTGCPYCTLAARTEEKEAMAAALDCLQAAAKDVAQYHRDGYGPNVHVQMVRLIRHMEDAIGDTPTAILAAVRAKALRTAAKRAREIENDGSRLIPRISADELNRMADAEEAGKR